MKNILIPMGGKGQRFKNAGYKTTKPLIDVDGEPMIKRVIQNLNIDGRYIFLVNDEDCKEFNLQQLLKDFCGKNECVVIIEDPTKRQGAAAACLLAEQYINNEDELIIANSDQLVNWSPAHFFETMQFRNADGGILTFTAHESKWSFAKINPASNLVIEVAEKNPISDRATVGIYWYKQGSDFISGLKQMINKNIRVNNEFYVCPVFNEVLEKNKRIVEYPVPQMIGLGTPEDLEKYLSSLK